MSIGPYIQAVEAQIRLLRVVTADAESALSERDLQRILGYRNLDKGNRTRSEAKSTVAVKLAHSDTFYMNDHFCDLVAHAKDTIPDTLAFDATWVQSVWGFLYLEVPVKQGSAQLEGILWEFTVGGDLSVMTIHRTWLAERESSLLFSNLTLREGETLFTASNTQYDSASKATSDDVRWIYCAFYLMAQRMSVTVAQKVDRAVRRRAEKAGNVAPEIVRVITLRRLEEAREKARIRGDVNWHWQWSVRGHWRNQFYPSENIHKPVFVEAYIKGPSDKPFKSSGLKLFAAVR